MLQRLHRRAGAAKQRWLAMGTLALPRHTFPPISDASATARDCCTSKSTMMRLSWLALLISLALHTPSGRL
eukprot:3974475-Prymnesium_polylepis.1